jgi:hypothetical protein
MQACNDNEMESVLDERLVAKNLREHLLAGGAVLGVALVVVQQRGRTLLRRQRRRHALRPLHVAACMQWFSVRAAR